MFDSLPSWVSGWVLLAAFVTATTVIWQKALGPLVRGVTKIADRLEVINAVPEQLATVTANVATVTENVATLTANVTRLTTTVNRINTRTREQLDPNGGDSMNDRVRRIDENTPNKEDQT